MVIFTARQNLANLNEVNMNLIVKFANLAGKSYNRHAQHHSVSASAESFDIFTLSFINFGSLKWYKTINGISLDLQ